MPEPENTPDVAALTVQLLSAYLANNTVPADDLASLIRTTRGALTEDSTSQVEAEPETYTPAVSVRKSLASQDQILSLIDGKPYKTLKRHLASHGLTPDTYRERYGLPATYPMVAPTFAARRREIAEQIGLGSRKATGTGSTAEASTAAISETQTELQDVAAGVAPVAKAKSGGSSKSKPAKKVASKSATAQSPNDTVSAPADAATTKSAGKPKSAKPVRPKKAPAKAGVSEKPVAAKPASGAAANEGQAGVVNEAAKPATKRRGKLGLFKSGTATDATAVNSDVAEANAAEPGDKVKADAKAPRGKRMARTAKDAPSPSNLSDTAE
ncbi:Ros/MucR family transcriptional regulator [Novosphingobium gossypii]|uniref:MucR family transcriptional regulator n=1 Tax=Novosphingobium gossypii TaxID=1604774 RepID=UPI003D242E3A